MESYILVLVYRTPWTDRRVYKTDRPARRCCSCLLQSPAIASAIAKTVMFWSCYFYGRLIIFLPCGFYLLSFFISSPNLSGRRSNVYHTSTHDVALVRIYNARVECAASGSLQIQDAKNRHFGTIAQLCRAISSEIRHVSTIGKKLVKHQYLLHMC